MKDQVDTQRFTRLPVQEQEAKIEWGLHCSADAEVTMADVVPNATVDSSAGPKLNPTLDPEALYLFENIRDDCLHPSEEDVHSRSTIYMLQGIVPGNTLVPKRNMPDLVAWLKSEKVQFLDRHSVEDVGYNFIRNSYLEEKSAEDLEDQVRRFHQFPSAKDNASSLESLGFLATGNKEPGFLYIGLEGELISVPTREVESTVVVQMFHSRNKKYTHSFHFGRSKLVDPDEREPVEKLSYKLVLNVGLANPLGGAIMESYDVFKQTAEDRILAAHGIQASLASREGNIRKGNIDIWRTIPSAEEYQEAQIAMASLGYRVERINHPLREAAGF
jgi:hypothetical protein